MYLSFLYRRARKHASLTQTKLAPSISSHRSSVEPRCEAIASRGYNSRRHKSVTTSEQTHITLQTKSALGALSAEASLWQLFVCRPREHLGQQYLDSVIGNTYGRTEASTKRTSATPQKRNVLKAAAHTPPRHPESDLKVFTFSRFTLRAPQSPRQRKSFVRSFVRSFKHPTRYVSSYKSLYYILNIYEIVYINIYVYSGNVTTGKLCTFINVQNETPHKTKQHVPQMSNLLQQQCNRFPRFFFLKPSAGVISEASPSQPHIYTDRALANGLLQGSIRNIQSQSNAHHGHTFLAKSTSVRFLHLKAAFVLLFFVCFFNEGKGTLGKTAAKSGRMCGRQLAVHRWRSTKRFGREALSKLPSSRTSRPFGSPGLATSGITVNSGPFFSLQCCERHPYGLVPKHSILAQPSGYRQVHTVRSQRC